MTDTIHYSAQQIAVFCDVPLKHVESWFDANQLENLLYKGERTVEAETLINFMHLNQIAIPSELMGIERSAATHKALIVELDNATAKSIAACMNSLSIKTSIVNNFFEATIRFLQDKPKLLTLDVGQNSSEAIELIHNVVNQTDRQAKILVVSDSMPSLISKAKNAGADAVIPKPIDKDMLKRSIKILLELN